MSTAAKPRLIAIANQKGGTGKSTVAVNVAAAIGEWDRKALVVDIDPQADASTMLGVDPGEAEHTIYDVLTGACELPEAIAHNVAAGVDLVIGSERMADVELTLAGQMMRERYLADALSGHTAAYDLVLLDCPPNLGLPTVNAFCAAPEVLVVVSMTDRNAYKGALALCTTVNELRRKGVSVAVTGIVRNSVDTHRSTYRLLNQALVSAGLPVLKAEIPMRADFQNAVTAGVPLVCFSPDHIGAEAMRRLADELLDGRQAQQAA